MEALFLRVWSRLSERWGGRGLETCFAITNKLYNNNNNNKVRKLFLQPESKRGLEKRALAGSRSCGPVEPQLKELGNVWRRKIVSRGWKEQSEIDGGIVSAGCGAGG